MKTILVFLALSLLLACSTPKQQQEDELMDAIEARVKLPEGRAVSQYARRYAVNERGLIVGIYAMGQPAPGPDESCDEVLENMAVRPAPCEELNGARLFSGQRQWVEKTNKLPVIADGGCGVITVIYDPKAGAVKSVTCNGVA